MHAHMQWLTGFGVDYFHEVWEFIVFLDIFIPIRELVKKSLKSLHALQLRQKNNDMIHIWNTNVDGTAFSSSVFYFYPCC